MTLAFSTEINGKETLFPEKIIRSLDISEPKKMTQFDLYYEVKPFEKWLNINDFFVLKPKIHTIREDKSKRWKVGNKIHFVINNRTKKRFQFAPVVNVKLIQKIFITPNSEIFRVNIDGKWLDDSQVEKLALNDGFNSVKDFFEWFNEDFVGNVIHWTDARY